MQSFVSEHSSQVYTVERALYARAAVQRTNKLRAAC